MQFVVMDNSTASDGDTLECSLDLPFSSCACFLSSEVKLIIVPYRILGEINMSMFIKCLEQWLTHGACFVSVGQYCINNMAYRSSKMILSSFSLYVDRCNSCLKYGRLWASQVARW